MDNASFDAIWKGWQAVDDLPAKVSEHVAERIHLYRILSALLARMEGRGAILEIGCGTAIDSYWLADAFPLHDFHATDLSPDSIAVAKKIGALLDRSINLEVADLFALPYASSSFDLIFSQGVMEHFPDLVAATRDQVRILKPAGYLVVSVPQKYNPYTIFKRRRIRAGTWPYGWETEYSVGEMTRFGRALGLEVISVHGHGYGYYEDYAFSLVPRLARRMIRRPEGTFLNRIGNLVFQMLRPLEDWFGHLFMQNILVVYRKGGPT